MMVCIIETKWPTSKIRELCDISRGSSPRPIADKRYFDGGHIPWIKIADATKSGKYLYETKEYVNEYGASFSKILPAGTIIVAASGTLGYTQILGVSGCAHDGWLVLANLKNLDKDYAYYVLQQMQQHFYNSAYGAAIQNINTEILRETQIPNPPLQIQRKIASILSAYDDLIENNMRRIKILEEMAQNLYREWFVNFRFPGHEQTRFVDSPLGQIPERWEVRHLNDTCNLIMGQSPKSEFYNDIGLGLPFHQGVTNFGSRFPVTKHYSTVTKRIAQKGDILFSVRAPVGRINIADTRLVIGRGLSAINHKNNWQWFLYHYLRDVFKEEDIIGGGTIYKSVTKKDMEDIKILNPQQDTVDYFESIVIPINNLIKALDKKNNSLRQTRDLLLPKLISGEVDVSELDINVPKEEAV